MTERDDDRARIRAVLKTINDAWSRGTPEALPSAVRDCFHDKVIFRGPDFRVVASGPEAAIASFVEFMRAAQIDRCRISDPDIDLAGDTAIATFKWQMSYHLNGDGHDEAGFEIDVLTRGDDHRWLVRWRTLTNSAK